MAEREAEVSDPRSENVMAWASLWGDLTLVDMLLLARAQLPNNAEQIFARRGLWEAAVIAYGRTVNNGRRLARVGELLDEMSGSARATHDAVQEWRNQHVAHRVDPDREAVSVHAVFDDADDDATMSNLRIRVTPTTGPEDEGTELAQQFADLVKELRDAAWRTRIDPLAGDLLEQLQERAGELSAEPTVYEGPPKGYMFTINPAKRA